MSQNISVKVKVWRQDGPQATGQFESFDLSGISTDMSFLEMLDTLNEQLLKEGKRPVEFDSDCREGICGSCGCMINGMAHGPERGATVCQLHMRSFKNGQTIVVEPWRATAFPVIKDLVVDRSAFDRIIAAGGYVSVKSGRHADANVMLVPKDTAEKAMDVAQCIGCGACVAACPNASASLFTGAKITHLALLPQGKVEAARRVQRMTDQMDSEGFGGCTNIGECLAACPKEIKMEAIVSMRREFIKGAFAEPPRQAGSDNA
ncbi:MAG TPA: succinate dehydrogenase/fumarate reductase iron-sulfur subunit [Oligoflexia bacterium]|nr:succinate dehydrogenase/fumarate reductase iron-sulfur subunit [Oligoflexia bacterium]